MRASDAKPGLRSKTRPQMQNPAPDATPDMRCKIRSRCKTRPRFKANNTTSDAKACPGGEPGTPAKPGLRHKTEHPNGAGKTLAKCKGLRRRWSSCQRCWLWTPRPLPVPPLEQPATPVARHCPSGNAATSRRLPPRPATGDTDVTPDSESSASQATWACQSPGHSSQ